MATAAEKALAARMKPENTDDYLYRVEGAGGNTRWFGHQAHAERRLKALTQNWKTAGREGKRPEMIAKARGQF